jgi:predicted GIY-YIG superfamily endonuclease
VYYVYLLKCSDDKTYIGSTEDLKDRLKRHQSGFVPATKNRLPVKLHFYMVFTDKYKAFNFEKYLKSGSGRALLKKRLI